MNGAKKYTLYSPYKSHQQNGAQFPHEQPTYTIGHKTKAISFEKTNQNCISMSYSYQTISTCGMKITIFI